MGKKGKTGSNMFIHVLLVQIWLFFNLNLKLWRVEDSLALLQSYKTIYFTDNNQIVRKRRE